MQHHRGAGHAVHRAVDKEGGGLDPMAARQHLAAQVDQYDVLGADLAPVQAARVDQVAALCPRQQHAEVVADAFGQAVVRGGAQGQREVFAQARDARAGVPGVGPHSRKLGFFFKHFEPQALITPA